MTQNMLSKKIRLMETHIPLHYLMKKRLSHKKKSPNSWGFFYKLYAILALISRAFCKTAFLVKLCHTNYKKYQQCSLCKEEEIPL